MFMRTTRMHKDGCDRHVYCTMDLNSGHWELWVSDYFVGTGTGHPTLKEATDIAIRTLIALDWEMEETYAGEPR